MSKSIFTKIIKREIPAHIVYEDSVCIVILDKFPMVKGQTLVIPKVESKYVFNLDLETYQHIFAIAKKIALASDAALDTVRTCLVVEGFHVPHVHIKLYPLQEGDRPLGEKLDMGEEATDEELTIIATQIQAAIEEED
jgi:histidine triad (HIT) family protein